MRPSQLPVAFRPAPVPVSGQPRLILAAVALCLGGLAGWATAFVPHAEREIGLEASTVTLALAVAVLLAAVTMRAAAGIAPGRRAPALLIGVLTLGAGLLATTVGVTTIGLFTALVPVAVGSGLVAALAPAVSATFAPPGEAARPAVVQLGAGALAAAAGALVAIWAVDGGVGHRTVFVLGGVAALAAVVPLLRVDGVASAELVRAVAGRAGRFAGWTGVLLAIAVLIHETGLLEADKALFEALHGLGATPEVVESLLVEPSLRNYVVIVLFASLLGARLWGRTTPGRTLLLVAGSGVVAYIGVRTCWALWERPRPEEVLGIDPVNGHSWAAYPSFPSGHVAVTTALALSTGALIPKLRYLLWGYAVVIAFTRLAYGAHFPSDVILGFAFGWLAVRATITPLSPQAPGRRSSRAGPAPAGASAG